MRTLHSLWTCLLFSFLLCMGCSKRPGMSMAPESGYDYGGYDDAEYEQAEAAEVYNFDDDMLDGEVLSPEGATLSSRGRSRHAGLVEVRGSFATRGAKSDAPVETGEGGEGGDALTEVELPKTDERAVPAARKRQVIYTATMQVRVYDVEGSVNLAESLPTRIGGWVQQRNDNLIVLRIPATELEDAMTVLAELGIVDERTLEALDVTAQYTDLGSRIRVLTEMHAQLEKLLAKAKTVEQALEIRKALDGVTMELELARGRMRELAQSIAFSTLVVRFVARGPENELPSTNDPFPWVINLGVELTEYR